MRYIKKLFKNLLLALLNLGWIFPFCLSKTFIYYLYQYEFIEFHMIRSKNRSIAIDWSFFSDKLLILALFWLALVILIWGIRIIKLSRKNEATEHKNSSFFWRVSGIFFFTGGWIIPFYLSNYFMCQFISSEVYPHLWGETNALSSDFPYMQVSKLLLDISCIWLALAILFWISVGIRAFDRIKKQSAESNK